MFDLVELVRGVLQGQECWGETLECIAGGSIFGILRLRLRMTTGLG